MSAARISKIDLSLGWPYFQSYFIYLTAQVHVLIRRVWSCIWVWPWDLYLKALIFGAFFHQNFLPCQVKPGGAGLRLDYPFNHSELCQVTPKTDQNVPDTPLTVLYQAMVIFNQHLIFTCQTHRVLLQLMSGTLLRSSWNRPTRSHKSIRCSQTDSEGSDSSERLFPLLESVFPLAMLFTLPLLATSGVLWQILFSAWLLSTGEFGLRQHETKQIDCLCPLMLLQYICQLFARLFSSSSCLFNYLHLWLSFIWWARTKQVRQKQNNFSDPKQGILVLFKMFNVNFNVTLNRIDQKQVLSFYLSQHTMNNK